MTEETTSENAGGESFDSPENETTEEVVEENETQAPAEDDKQDSNAPKETFQLARVITLLGFFAAITALAAVMNVFLDLDSRLENVDLRSGVAISSMEQKVNAMYEAMSDEKLKEKEPRDEKGRQLLIKTQLSSALVITQSISDDTEYPERVRQAAAMAQADISALLASMADIKK